MSQSDYIKLKRISQELSNIRQNLDPVISSEQYTQYKGYTLAYNIPNDKTVYSVELLSDKQNVLDMERPLTMECGGFYPNHIIKSNKEFYLCTGTDQRKNRVYDPPGYGLFINGVYPKNQNKDLFHLSTPGYIGHLKSVNYINTNLCKNGKYVCNPAPAKKNASYAGYIDRKKAQNYAKLIK